MTDDRKFQKELALIRDIIIQTVPVEQMYLFGSYAYGTPRKESDFDIYVVLKDDAPMRDLEAMDMIGLALYGKKSMPTDILVLKRSRFNYRQGALTLNMK
ncbi:hypothetical protein FACS1894130_01250 [Spirochaetia bacterium]|nr:hypothetical protein FACS1894130_01250 [Spirochaetia bacterium]